MLIIPLIWAVILACVQPAAATPVARTHNSASSVATGVAMATSAIGGAVAAVNMASGLQLAHAGAPLTQLEPVTSVLNFNATNGYTFEATHQQLDGPRREAAVKGTVTNERSRVSVWCACDWHKTNRLTHDPHTVCVG